MTSQRSRTRQPSDPWADWALDADASAAQPVEASVAMVEPLPVVRRPAPMVESQWAPHFEPDEAFGDEVLAPSFPVLPSSKQPLSSSTNGAPSVPAGLSAPLPTVPPKQMASDLVEDFTGEFEAIEAGEWDDEPFRYLDDPTGTISQAAPITQPAPAAKTPPTPARTPATASAAAAQSVPSPALVPTPPPAAKPASPKKPANATNPDDPGKPDKPGDQTKSTAVLSKKRRRRRRARRVGLASLTVVVLAATYITWQFATLRRNEANSRTLDLPGVAPIVTVPTTPTLPGTPTTLPGNNFDPDQTEFEESLPVDAEIVAPVSTTPVVTIPGQGSCDDDPACANAPVVVLPEAEKPREGGLLVDRVSVEPIGGVNAQNILLIGSDSRADLPDDQKTGFGTVGGNRSDTLIVMRISPDGKTAALLSFPRDTYVHLAGTGKNDRINSAYAKGVNSLVRTIQENFNLPINHVAEIDFSGFQKIVGTLGGIEICFDHPARDKVTKLDVEAGCQLLNQTQATAYVRSRHYEQLIDGQWKSDGRGDIGRVQRQQRFIKQVLEKVIGSGGRNPITAQGLISDLKSAVTLDKTYGITELYGTAKTFSAFEPDALQGFTLPTSAARIDGKAVLRVKREEASQLVARFGVRQ